MEKLKAFSDLFDSLTGRAQRHNRALRDVIDWSTTIHDFLTKYNVEESRSLDLILEHIGEVKFDLTNIAYKARAIIPISKHIKGRKVSSLIEEIMRNLEEFRIQLIRPDLNRTRLVRLLPRICELFKNLQDLLLETEYK
ncbi:MAG: hypothetical protein GTO60_07585 [Gammaproteobacteria bacterium]|nr:hypothetical protein [Gammaproteobacteria bacterium]